MVFIREEIWILWKKMGKKSLEAGWRINKLKPHVCRCLSFGEPANNFVILKLEGAKHYSIGLAHQAIKRLYIYWQVSLTLNDLSLGSLKAKFYQFGFANLINFVIYLHMVLSSSGSLSGWCPHTNHQGKNVQTCWCRWTRWVVIQCTSRCLWFSRRYLPDKESKGDETPWTSVVSLIDFEKTFPWQVIWRKVKPALLPTAIAFNC